MEIASRPGIPGNNTNIGAEDGCSRFRMLA
jgi:hypothetical protein